MIEKFKTLQSMLQFSIRMSQEQFAEANDERLRLLSSEAKQNHDRYVRDVYLFMKECTQNQLFKASMVREQLDYIY